MLITIVAFDRFTDIDVFMPWDLLNRVSKKDWKVKIIGTKETHTSISGLTIPTHGLIEETSMANCVLFASGPGTRDLVRDHDYLKLFNLNPEKQLIGSMCSGALVLGALGLLNGKKATTYPSAKQQLETYGVHVIEKDFVVEKNIATAAGCLSAQELSGWVIERLADKQTRENVMRSIQPVGKGLSF